VKTESPETHQMDIMVSVLENVNTPLNEQHVSMKNISYNNPFQHLNGAIAEVQ
jgi:hypothetical protein